jgi:ribosomal protein S18 acetylase RimI-like enzyme
VADRGVSVETWDAATAQEHVGDLFAVYDEVFGDVSDLAAWRVGAFDRHCARAGFRLTAAVSDAKGVIGFAYGYVGERGQWWPDQVTAALPAEVAEVWVGGHFEFVELGVLTAFRGQGIGGRLHDQLMAGTEQRRALLGTDDADSPAVALYTSRGWRKLGNLTADTAILGRWVGSDP